MSLGIGYFVLISMSWFFFVQNVLLRAIEAVDLLNETKEYKGMPVQSGGRRGKARNFTILRCVLIDRLVTSLERRIPSTPVLEASKLTSFFSWPENSSSSVTGFCTNCFIHFFLDLIVTCTLFIIYVREDNCPNVQVMITRLIWTLIDLDVCCPKRLLNLITHSLPFQSHPWPLLQ